MSWNIGIIAVKASAQEIDNIIPDVFYKESSNAIFEDVTSCVMSKNLSVTFTNEWVVIIDVSGRVFSSDNYLVELARNYKVNAYFVSEQPRIWKYKKNFFGKISKYMTINSNGDGVKYLKSQGIRPLDDFGETIVFQAIDYDIFGNKNFGGLTSLFDLKFDVYALD